MPPLIYKNLRLTYPPNPLSRASQDPISIRRIILVILDMLQAMAKATGLANFTPAHIIMICVGALFI
jgi:hypothetical protein